MNPDPLKEYNGYLKLKEDWASHLLKSMDWVNRRGRAIGKNFARRQILLSAVRAHELY